MLEMNKYLKAFMCQIFGEDLMLSEQLTPTQKKQFVLSMLTVVFAHRHNKKDLYIVETAEANQKDEEMSDKANYFDFSIMRNVMYQYSKKAQLMFFEHEIECFFMAFFACS